MDFVDVPFGHGAPLEALARVLRRRRLQELGPSTRASTASSPRRRWQRFNPNGGTDATGALVGFERMDRRTLIHLKHAQLLGFELTVPTPVIAEAWQGGSRSARIASLLDACVIDRSSSILRDLPAKQSLRSKGLPSSAPSHRM